MIFSKHINRYYLRFLPLLFGGLLALLAVSVVDTWAVAPFLAQALSFL